ncbi:MAG TPA: phosphoenolpyruvate carboxykinase (ATP) [Desulfarculaceae bacterium]|nr:phosphoenolpyruvate carboxykinase (ATP) [Desulfarculaceae bacterium]
MSKRAVVDAMLEARERVAKNPARPDMIKMAVDNREVIIAANGALATWTPPESTGRSPKDTLIVKRAASEAKIDWDSPNNIPVSEETFEMLFADAVEVLSKKSDLYVTDRVLGADSTYALPVKTVTDQALTALFTDNMFRPIPDDIEKSFFFGKEFTLLALPYDKLDRDRYQGRLRNLADGKASDLAVVIDLDQRVGIVYGSAYCGSVKKLMFSVMNYMLPEIGILPLHCSANEGPNGHVALLLGLSGTGKTTLSADPERALLGDDEHGWSDAGVANFENGCYAKMINIDAEKEPEIYHAVMHEDDYLKHGSIVENAMLYPNGFFDFDDERLTPNSRGSYLLSELSNIKPSSVAGHPQTILFLTADANGVLPPISKLDPAQAMLWFLMGYTSKLAGTETGITEPVTTFSRFFGEPFMPCNPDVYAGMLGARMESFKSEVFLVNTGWSGGPFGEGERMDIKLTRALVKAAMNGDLAEVDYIHDPIFHVMIPQSCPGVEAKILNPRDTWRDGDAYDKRAQKLAGEFAIHFEKAYGNKNIASEVVRQCPGR